MEAAAGSGPSMRGEAEQTELPRLLRPFLKSGGGATCRVLEGSEGSSVEGKRRRFGGDEGLSDGGLK